MNFGSLAIVSMGSLWKWFSVVFEKILFLHVFNLCAYMHKINTCIHISWIVRTHMYYFCVEKCISCRSFFLWAFLLAIIKLFWLWFESSSFLLSSSSPVYWLGRKYKEVSVDENDVLFNSFCHTYVHDQRQIILRWSLFYVCNFWGKKKWERWRTVIIDYIIHFLHLHVRLGLSPLQD